MPKRFRPLVLLAVPLLLTARSVPQIDGPLPENRRSALSSRSDTLTTEQLLEIGDTIYFEWCGDCHGYEWEGGLAGSLADIEWTYVGDGLSIEQVIRSGVEDEGMPAWGDILTDAEVQGVIALIQSKSPSDAE